MRDVLEGPRLDHPVRSFVLVLIGVGALLLGVQWSGAVQPRLESHGQGFAELVPPVEALGFRNAGPLPVEVRSVDWPVRTGSAGEPAIAPWTEDGDGGRLSYVLEPFAPFTLDAGETAYLGRTLGPCPVILGPLRIQVRTAAGIARTVELDAGGSAAGVCSGQSG